MVIRFQFNFNTPSPSPKGSAISSVLNQEQTIQEIGNKLRRLIEGHILAGGKPSIMIPPVMELSGIFSCSEVDILKALNALKQEGYCYHLANLDSPIILQDRLYQDMKRNHSTNGNVKPLIKR